MHIPAATLPGLNRLALTYLQDFDAVREFYGTDYRTLDNLERHARTVTQHTYPRAALAQALLRQNHHWGAGEKVLANIAALAQPGSLAVVTGQQVGIFGGPLFTLYKALTCVKLAEALQIRLQQPVVPVFWLAADDDDLAEMNHVLLMTPENELVSFSCPLDTTTRRPAAQVHLGAAMAECHRALAQAVSDSEFKGEILEALAQAYAAGRSLPEAFARWLLYLLGEWGLVPLNPTDVAIRRLGLPLLLREFEEDSPSTRAALHASARLEQAGFGVPVPLRPGRFNVFYVDDVRHALEKQAERVVSTDGRVAFSARELALRLQEAPQQFSPNVILRPLLQDALLPNLAYIAGPGEIAYFAQLRGVYEALEVPMPAIFPRKSLTLLEGRIKRVQEKYHLPLPAFWSRPAELLSRVAREHAPEGLFEPVAAARDALSRRLDELKQRATALDAPLAGFIDKERGKIFHQLAIIENKLLQAAKRQNETLTQQILKAAHALYPRQQLQEREFSIVPFLCKHGRGLVRRLYDLMEVQRFDHQVIELF
ncbi:MAG: bacillithiol biosynthesis cysteine-adding enzyme BshC [candidate division KSB1 bacterium]|nr:bacillithiol biosynthesis cysteine-adding enzyme BshC [candidate division KSB1 bacterium]MDZ7274792.1 bacillithiol biosynthesis cysteine-adding enzyme BshC [candidate division KSB1 bacterium]MDZ7285616.1 bacillithiol biosynthesis cysteine-adding enzyme BshC [candidate division KSB1 bacterium]MDZ7298648.1 bacillithiol biosynthesis cysteine-adding enzyme BshC [candidate division KSB1 bacterium]MDZ7307488.1 bacillithiol biosynthesis cysteine-adding enzyme BshC [candidate division KSB1 bacterium